jgi:hypothetical protein
MFKPLDFIYVFFLCGSQKKQRLFPLYSINWLVCITEMECVYCAVQAEFLNNGLIPIAELRVPQTWLLQFRGSLMDAQTYKTPTREAENRTRLH